MLQPPPEQEDGFDELVLGQYPESYHPPPFKLKAACEISFSTKPPHWGHLVSGASENFWRISN